MANHRRNVSEHYDGPAYSVKYLGIVDGTMGILSRKMALQSILKDKGEAPSYKSKKGTLQSYGLKSL